MKQISSLICNGFHRLALLLPYKLDLKHAIAGCYVCT